MTGEPQPSPSRQWMRPTGCGQPGSRPIAPWRPQCEHPIGLAEVDGVGGRGVWRVSTGDHPRVAGSCRANLTGVFSACALSLSAGTRPPPPPGNCHAGTHRKMWGRRDVPAFSIPATSPHCLDVPTFFGTHMTSPPFGVERSTSPHFMASPHFGSNGRRPHIF